MGAEHNAYSAPACICTCIARYLRINIKISTKSAISISYCMICVSAWEDNPSALATLVSGLSPIQTHNYTIKHAFELCALQNILCIISFLCRC